MSRPTFEEVGDFIQDLMDNITLNQSILELKGKKREGKEYSEGLLPSFVRYYPVRFYGLQDGRDSDWLTFKTCNSDLTTAPPGSL